LRVPLHRDRAITTATFSESAQIRSDKTKVRIEVRKDGFPESAARRKWMQQNDIRPIPKNIEMEVHIVASQFHGVIVALLSCY
jgi:hypothetical protein